MVGGVSGKGRVRERDGDLARAERTNGLSETTRMGGRGSATRRPTIAGDERDTHHAFSPVASMHTQHCDMTNPTARAHRVAHTRAPFELIRDSRRR